MCLVFTDPSDSPRAKLYNSPASSVSINNSAKLSCVRLWNSVTNCGSILCSVTACAQREKTSSKGEHLALGW
jgi:hypothetical protein